MRKLGKFGSIAVVALAVVLLGAACGSDENPPGGGGGGATPLSGTVVVTGSSTVQPISSFVAESFNEQNPGVTISVDGPGTGDGFAVFCKGEADATGASRAIKDEEKTACQQAGVNFAELKIGLDGITVMTNPANSAVTCLTKADLYALVGPESTGFKKWSDASALAKQLGGKDTFPNAPLDITAPGEESGTYDAFIELALKDIAGERGKDEATRPDYQSSGNDNVIIQGIEGSQSSFGWVGFAYAEQNASGVKILEVDGGDGCITPTRETIANGSYPLTRPLFIYVNTDKAKSNTALKAYVDFYMQDLAGNVTGGGYVPPTSDVVQTTQQSWQSALS